MKPQTYDRERVHFNLARLNSYGRHFEIAVDPDLAIAYRNSKGKTSDIREVIKSEKIFDDVKRGLLAAEGDLSQVFGTHEVLKIASKIILEGEIQLSEEYREKIRDAKKRQLINLIARNALDPRTKLPHPPQRIENAFEEAKVRIDDFKSPEDQLDAIVKQLRPVLPISFEKKKIEVHLPSAIAAKAYPIVMQFAKPYKEEWRNDGSYYCLIEMAAGIEPEFYERLNKITHGAAETKVIK